MSVISQEEYLGLNNDESLEHYGRLGMKWGQHIFGEEKAKARAERKLVKLDKKATKAGEKAGKKQTKAYAKQAKASSAILFKKSKARKAARASQKAYTTALKANNRIRKAYEWNKTMNDVFKNSKVKFISKESKNVGKKYTQMTLADINSTQLAVSSLRTDAAYYERLRKTRYGE